MADPMESKRRDYILALVRELERRAVSGELDEALAERIERLLGEGRRDGEAEYASWLSAPVVASCREGCAPDQCKAREHGVASECPLGIRGGSRIPRDREDERGRGE